jgi:hypothetical protein
MPRIKRIFVLPSAAPKWRLIAAPTSQAALPR